MRGYDIGNNATVIKMASLHITGNVIDLKWFRHLKLESGKPDSLGILLLGDIVYWYRPIEVRDEETGSITGYRKKFAADKLQRSYGAFAEAYGYTKDQVKDALGRLEDARIIDLDFRHPMIGGQKLGNVLFVGLNVDRLAEISSPLSPLNGIGYGDKSTDPLTFKDDTNTEITPETTTESSQKEAANPLFALFMNNVSMVTPLIADAIEKAEKDYSSEWVSESIQIAGTKGAKSWRYCETILERWKREGKSEPRANGKKVSVAASGDHSKYLESEYAEYIEH
jgi:DnaD/phage-associated family protein